VLPVALYLSWILSQQVFSKGTDDPVDGLGIRPACRLSEPNVTLIGGDAHKMCATEEERLDLRDLHDVGDLFIMSSTMRLAAILCLGLAACSAGPPATPTSEPGIALYVATNGPHPVYATYGEWLAIRAPGAPAAQSESLTIAAGRIARAQNRFDPDDGAWLLAGCTFGVLSTSPDEQDPTYQWAFGQVVHCDEPVADGVLEPQMGVRPAKLWVYDGLVGYFPMSLLEPFRGGAPPASR
jgi:hypothetical protein